MSASESPLYPAALALSWAAFLRVRARPCLSLRLAAALTRSIHPTCLESANLVIALAGVSSSLFASSWGRFSHLAVLAAVNQSDMDKERNIYSPSKSMACCQVSRDNPKDPLPPGLKVFALAPDQDLKPLVTDAIRDGFRNPVVAGTDMELKHFIQRTLEQHEISMMLKIEDQFRTFQVVMEHTMQDMQKKQSHRNRTGTEDSNNTPNNNSGAPAKPPGGPAKTPAKTPVALHTVKRGQSKDPGQNGKMETSEDATKAQPTHKEFYKSRTETLVNNWDDESDNKKKHKPLPTVRERFQILVAKPKFDLFFGMLIVINAFIMCLQIEYQGGIMAEGLGLKNDVPWEGATEAFDGMEHFFNIMFAIELFIRVSAFGCKFFREPANCMDCFIVVINVIDGYILTPMQVGLGVGFDVARLLRIARLVRVLRIVRVMKIFRELRILVRTIGSSFGALIWSMVLLFVLQLMCGIFLSQMLQEYIVNEQNALETRMFVFRYFGSATKAMFSMFELTIGGWVKIARPLVEEVNPWLSIFFVGYVAGVSFAIMKIITAIFLRKTLQVANSDAEMIMYEKRKAQERYADALRKIFDDLDDSGDGLINWEEFNEICSDPQVKNLMSMLELEVTEIAGLFNLLDDGDGRISAEEFLAGVTRLKGGAKSIDVMTLLTENQKLVRQVKSVAIGLDDLLIAQGLAPMEYIPKHCMGPELQGVDLDDGRVEV